MDGRTRRAPGSAARVSVRSFLTPARFNDKLWLMRAVASLVGVALSATFLPGAEIPSVVPQVSSVFPHSIGRGGEAMMELRGSYLDGAAQIQFLNGSLRGKVESSSFRTVRARIAASADAEPGRHDFRLITPRGIWLGFLWVSGGMAESDEIEPNDGTGEAQRLELPAAVNGRADSADGDYYRFSARAGQTLVFDVLATRLGSALDPVLTLLDGSGKEIANNDDAYPFKDARLVHRFERDGDYFIAVSASFERSARDAEYRLLATSGPFVTSTLPLGGRRGTTVEATLSGFNLNQATGVRFGAEPGPVCRIVSKTAEQMRVSIAIPSSARAGTHYLHVDGGGPPVRFEVGDLPEAQAEDGGPVTAPVIVNGAIPHRADRPRRSQEIALDVKAGERLELAVDSWKLGVVMDPVVSVFDPSGRMIAQEDDPAPNSFIHHPASHDPRMVVEFPTSGRYRVQIRDAAYQAGGGYRLNIRPVEPDFEVEVRSPQFAAIAGRTSRLLAVVRRTGGVARVEAFRKPDSEIEHFRRVETGGWNTPIRVLLAGLPQGSSAQEAIAEPVNTAFKGNDGEELFVDGTVVEIPVAVAAGAKPGLYPVTVRAAGEFGGRKLERQAKVLHGAPRAYRHEPTADQKLWLNVIQAPPILWNTPAEITISAHQPGRIKVGLVRLDGDFPVEVSAMRHPAGWALGSAHAAAGTEELEVPVAAMPDAGASTGELVLVAKFDRGGHAESVESPPIQLRIKP